MMHRRDNARETRATFAAMNFRAVYFAYFWYSNRPAAGEASAHAK